MASGHDPPVGHVAGGGEDLLHALPADDTARQFGEHPADRPHRERQHGEEEGDADHVVHADRALAQPKHADNQHGESAEARQYVQERIEEAAQPANTDHRVAQFAGFGAEALRLLLLASHGLDDERPVEALMRDGAGLGPQGLRPSHPGRHKPRVDHVDAEQCREDGQADQREGPVDHEQRHDRHRAA